ncbi:MAG: hypothetical protein ACK41E_05615 [Deinococcales bacterium]
MKDTPWWMYIVVIAIGVGLGLVLRPVLQNTLSGSAEVKPNVRCIGPEGSELALSERLSTSGFGQSQTTSRTYVLERPGLAPLQFEGGTDSERAPLACEHVAFGPGARVSFVRANQVVVIELVGPVIRRFSFIDDRVFSALALDPKFKLGLRLEDYTPRAAPNIEEAGKNGRLELRRKTPDPILPTTLVFSTYDGGINWSLVR